MQTHLRCRPQVMYVIDALLSREGLASLPVLALGASSGGSFVLTLALASPRVWGVAAQIMAVPPHLLT